MRRAPTALIVAAVVLSPVAVLAQGTLLGDFKDGYSTANVYTDPPDDPGRLFGGIRIPGLWVDGSLTEETDRSAGGKSLRGSMGFHGRGLGADGSFDWRQGYDTGSPGKGGGFSEALFDGALHMDATWDQSDLAATADSGSWSQVLFTVDHGTAWTWSAHVAGESVGDSDANYSFNLQVADPEYWSDGFLHAWVYRFGEDPYSASHTLSGNFDEDVFLDGVLPAGTYMLTVSMMSHMSGTGFFYDPWSVGSASVSMTDGIFHLGGGVPAPGAMPLLGAGALLAARRRRVRSGGLARL